MVTSASTQHSTPLDLNALPALVAEAIAAQPGQRGRIERAAMIVAFRQIKRSGAGWLVESEAHPGEMYAVVGDTCQCADRLNRGQFCKHLRAVAFLLQLERLAQAAPTHCKVCGSTDRVGRASGECHTCATFVLFGEVA